MYDRLDRLIAVVDPAGDTALYQYDAVGNLTGISRQSSTLVSVIELDAGSHDRWPYVPLPIVRMT